MEKVRERTVTRALQGRPRGVDGEHRAVYHPRVVGGEVCDSFGDVHGRDDGHGLALFVLSDVHLDDGAGGG